MAGASSHSSPKALQHLGLILIMLLAMSALCVVIWRSARATSGTDGAHIEVHTLQQIPALHDTVQRATPHHADTTTKPKHSKKGSTHKGSSGRRSASKSSRTSAEVKQSQPTRDLRHDRVSPYPGSE